MQTLIEFHLLLNKIPFITLLNMFSNGCKEAKEDCLCGAEGDYDQSLGQTPVNPCLVSWVLAWTNLL